MHVNLKIKRWKASVPFQIITFIAISEMSSSLNYQKLHAGLFWFGRPLIPSFVSSVSLIVTGIFSLAIFSFDLIKKVNDIFSNSSVTKKITTNVLVNSLRFFCKRKCQAQIFAI